MTPEILNTIPDPVVQAFEGKPHLSLPELAKAAHMALKTLRKQREAGVLPVHIKGTGVTRRHWVCTLADVAEFYRRTTGEACQYFASEDRHSTSSTSRSKVIAFTGPQRPRMNVRLVTSKTARRPKPAD